MEREKGQTFREIILLLSVVTLFVGLGIFLLSFFFCIELDTGEEQRNACNAQAGIVRIICFFTVFGSIGSIIYGITGILKRNSKLN